MGTLLDALNQEAQDRIEEERRFLYTRLKWYSLPVQFPEYSYFGWSDMKTGEKMGTSEFIVMNASVGAVFTGARHSTESAAIAEAEKAAQTYPGNEYKVYKAVSKSVAVKPVTTTRL